MAKLEWPPVPKPLLDGWQPCCESHRGDGAFNQLKHSQITNIVMRSEKVVNEVEMNCVPSGSKGGDPV